MRFTSIVAVCMVALAALAGKTPSNIPVTSYLSDSGPTGVPYSVQSDRLGAYLNGVQGVGSILTANTYHSLPPGDWQLDVLSSATRNITVTLSSANAVQPGQPGYQAPANPPFWGTRTLPGHIEDKCTAIYNDLLTMSAGQTFQCPAIVRFASSQKNAYYRLDMTGSWTGIGAYTESTQVRVQCNTVGSDGNCNDWFMDPIPVVNPDGTISPGTAIARLVEVFSSGPETNDGDFYLTFHFHITRP